MVIFGVYWVIIQIDFTYFTFLLIKMQLLDTHIYAWLIFGKSAKAIPWRKVPRFNDSGAAKHSQAER